MSPGHLLCCLWAGMVCLSDAAPANSTASTPAAASVMDLPTVFPDLTTAIRLISNNEDLAGYLSNPNSVCTFFAPTNAGISTSIASLGKFAGLATQNSTLQNDILNYHVITGRALTASDLTKINDTVTRSGQTLYIFQQGGRPMLYSRPDYPVALNKTDIKAGKCIVHTINVALVPPTAIAQIQAWLDELGSTPPTPPRQDWGPVRNQQQADLVKISEEKLAGNSSNSNGTVQPSPAAKTSTPASSGHGSVHQSITQGCLYPLLMGAVVLAAHLI